MLYNIDLSFVNNLLHFSHQHDLASPETDLMSQPLKVPVSFMHYRKSPEHKVRLNASFQTNLSASSTFTATPVTKAAVEDVAAKSLKTTREMKAGTSKIFTLQPQIPCLNQKKVVKFLTFY